MSTPFIGSLMSCSWNFAPKGFALCDGTLLAINQNQALFSLLGTTFGGNGQTNFALPDLRGRTPIGSGQGPGLGNNYTLGQRGGEEGHLLSIGELPQHIHTLSASNAAASLPKVTANSPGVTAAAVPLYGPYSAATPMNAGSLGRSGGSQPHENRQPFLIINWVIALNGIFPSQN